MERNQEKNEKILTKIFNLSLNFILISFLIQFEFNECFKQQSKNFFLLFFKFN